MADPARLGKYEIRGALGKGAMGIVYKGFDPHIERYVAIKTIRKDLVEPEVAKQYMARFKNEAKAAGRLTHPNIVAVYEYGEDDAVAYIAMEYVEGAGLRDHLNRRETFDFAQLVVLMRQVLDALEFAHVRGVIHRDVKPSNLIVTDGGQLKVADFGIARVDTSNLTQAGMVIGTPSYMSPEQCRGLEADGRSDLWSCGVVLYELLTGEKPFRGTIETIAYKICHEEPPAPSTLSKLALPPEVDKLVAKALAKAPANRYQGAREFRDALNDVAKLSVEVDQGLGTTVVNIGTLMLAKPPPAWDDETLRTAEHELARAVGPMAKVIVRRAAAQTLDRSELCAILSDSITDPESRRRFVTAFNKAGGGQSSSGASGVRAGSSGAGQASSSGTRGSASGTGAMTSPLEAAYVDEVTAHLAIYIGPIAQVLTKKAARESRTRSEFVRRCSENLGTQDRAAFLRDLGYE
ncbi:MAG TPA: serine/threonine-protein kinase [Burkholderiales bacterium]|nr:serine/threonine-protein kinase [Burkholderiales bacterium]